MAVYMRTTFPNDSFWHWISEHFHFNDLFVPDTEDMMKEYLAVQEEIDSVLEAPPQEGEIPEVFKSSTSKG